MTQKAESGGKSLSPDRSAPRDLMILASHVNLRVSNFVHCYNNERESQALSSMFTQVQEVRNDCDGYSQNFCVQTGIF